MKIYFSGWGGEHRPAGLDRRPSFMLTYYDLHKGVKKASTLLEDFLERRRRHVAASKVLGMPEEDCFIDSGAWSLFRLHGLKLGKKAEKKKQEGPDWSFFELKLREDEFKFRNRKFRAYCDAYAEFMRKSYPLGISYFANLDVIGSPKLTAMTQRYFEEEHGLTPVPVVHFPTGGKDTHAESHRYLDLYLEKGYTMIGLGGMARRPDKKDIKAWVDECFLRICPASNKRMPVTKVHGFAMTTWELMHRWPWFSVDSTSYLLYGTYGLLCIPRWSESRQCFRYDVPPKVVSISARGRPIDYKTRLHITNTYDKVDWGTAQVDLDGKGMIKDLGHGSMYEREAHSWTMKWLEYVGVGLGSVDKEGKMVEPGVVSSNEVRTDVNLRYFMEMEQRIEKWPHKLDERIILEHAPARSTLTFGLDLQSK